MHKTLLSSRTPIRLTHNSIDVRSLSSRTPITLTLYPSLTHELLGCEAPLQAGPLEVAGVCDGLAQHGQLLLQPRVVQLQFLQLSTQPQSLHSQVSILSNLYILKSLHSQVSILSTVSTVSTCYTISSLHSLYILHSLQSLHYSQIKFTKTVLCEDLSVIKHTHNTHYPSEKHLLLSFDNQTFAVPHYPQKLHWTLRKEKPTTATGNRSHNVELMAVIRWVK